MKKIGIIFTIVAVTITFLGIDFAYAGRIAERQIRQHQRIHQGVARGELSCCERRALVREQRRIERCKRAAWSDRRRTYREHRRLERKLKRASRHIYRSRHNHVRQCGPRWRNF